MYVKDNQRLKKKRTTRSSQEKATEIELQEAEYQEFPLKKKLKDVD